MNDIGWLFELANFVTVICVMSFAAFAAFGWDKAAAENGKRRVSEAALLNLALFGGIVGAYAGRALFRHKTRKQPFSRHLHTVALLQLFAAVFLTIFLW
ncbi:DUF1294 domain-containing protein [Erythrobacter longus]|uniref:DUF1294 domain-containing protein n=1 Tax=Erythrobacter longus TaxID=1044 RepID=UPI000A916356|nr:DUF1294 domain-containing protein [Erythrobacter longus]